MNGRKGADEWEHSFTTATRAINKTIASIMSAEELIVNNKDSILCLLIVEIFIGVWIVIVLATEVKKKKDISVKAAMVFALIRRFGVSATK